MAKVAIVLLTKNPEDFHVWLEYHLNYLKFSRVFVSIEDTPDLVHILEPYKEKITYEIVDSSTTKDNYFTLMQRQNRFINKSIKQCQDMGIDYILHMDDDELFNITNSTTYKTVPALFASFDPSFQCLHFTNFEAVFPSDQQHCFDTTRFLKCGRGHCKSYGNGKSAGKVSSKLKPNGPHYFKGKVHNVSTKDAVILHFDSCTYKRWYSKFENLSNISNEKLKKIPFSFYKNSIRLFQQGRSEAEKESYYKKQKQDPFYNLDTITCDIYNQNKHVTRTEPAHDDAMVHVVLVDSNVKHSVRHIFDSIDANIQYVLHMQRGEQRSRGISFSVFLVERHYPHSQQEAQQIMAKFDQVQISFYLLDFNQEDLKRDIYYTIRSMMDVLDVVDVAGTNNHHDSSLVVKLPVHGKLTQLDDIFRSYQKNDDMHTFFSSRQKGDEGATNIDVCAASISTFKKMFNHETLRSHEKLRVCRENAVASIVRQLGLRQKKLNFTCLKCHVQHDHCGVKEWNKNKEEIFCDADGLFCSK